MQDWWEVTFPNGRQTVTIIDASGYPVQIAYGEKGTGKPLFLVHGIGSWSFGWRHNIDKLSQHFRVICFDAKGHGFSDKPLYAEQVGHQIIEMKRIVEALCDRPAIVVAISLGALVTLGAASLYPGLFDRLIVINVPIFPERLPNRAMRLLSYLPIDLVRTVDNLRLLKLCAPLVQRIIEIERREVVVNPESITSEDVYWIAYPYINFTNALTKYAEELQKAAREIDRLLNKEPNLIGNIQENLPKINCPTLILWGEQDQWFDVSNGKKLQRHLPGSQLKILPNCGHDPSVSCPEIVNEAILEFWHNTNFASVK
ncbi:alpha/beta fold hydrolase [Floridanema evergladense]|uniref:Alpha/beta fold hydrolase n=1 Tax=Floridaenema evergladense BLCC-F167 TaxID=3153639 RepID=A0ABV4WS41_9CYAN